MEWKHKTTTGGLSRKATSRWHRRNQEHRQRHAATSRRKPANLVRTTTERMNWKGEGNELARTEQGQRRHLGWNVEPTEKQKNWVGRGEKNASAMDRMPVTCATLNIAGAPEGGAHWRHRGRWANWATGLFDLNCGITTASGPRMRAGIDFGPRVRTVWPVIFQFYI